MWNTYTHTYIYIYIYKYTYINRLYAICRYIKNVMEVMLNLSIESARRC